MNYEVHFVGYLYIMDPINAWKIEYNIMILHTKRSEWRPKEFSDDIQIGKYKSRSDEEQINTSINRCA